MRENHEKFKNVSVQILAFSAFVGFLFSFFGCLLFGWMATKTLMFEYAAMIASMCAIFTAIVVHWCAGIIVAYQHKEYAELQTWARRFLHDPEHFTSSPSYQFAPLNLSKESVTFQSDQSQPETMILLAVNELYQRWQEAKTHQSGRLGEILAHQKGVNVGDDEYVEKQLQQHLSHQLPLDDQNVSGKLLLIDVDKASITDCLQSVDVDFEQWFSETITEIASYSHRFEHSALFSVGNSGVLVSIPKLSSGEHVVVADKMLSIVLDRLPHKRHCNFAHLGVQDFSKDYDAMQLLQLVKMALYAAKEKRISSWHYFEPDALQGDVAASDERWDTRLQSIIARHDVVMVTHPVFVSRTLNINHYELHANIRDSNGCLVQHDVFLPIAHQLTMQVQIDKAICARSIELLEYEEKDSDVYCLRLFVESLLSTEFRAWFLGQLTTRKKLAKRLMIEIKQIELLQHASEMKAVLNELQKLGVKLVINEVSLQQEDWSLLANFDIAQLKISASHVRNIDKSSERRQKIAALHQFAKSTNSKVVACGVSASSEWKAIQQLNIYSAEGSYFAQGMSALVNLQLA